jgi:hypothetical protein
MRFGEVRRAFGNDLNKIVQPVIETGIPRYVPHIFASYLRAKPLDTRWAAIPLYRLIGYKRGRGYTRLIDDRQGFDERFQLSRDASLIAIGSNFDQKLENFWAHLDRLDEITPLTFLGIRLVTVPNFSFFTDMMQPSILYNFGRIVLATEAIQASGFTPVPHLNALTGADWDRWHSYLRGQPEIRYVAKEFGTGLQSPAVGVAQIRKLADLQNGLGRSLHVIAIGGGQFTPYLAHYFQNFTVVDSDAYIKTVRRQEARFTSSRIRWTKHETEEHEPLDELLLSNVTAMRDYIEELARRKTQIPKSDDTQMQLRQKVA